MRQRSMTLLAAFSQARVEALGGLYILAHSKDELREALFAAFGLDNVVGWELAGKARAAAKRKRT